MLELGDFLVALEKGGLQLLVLLLVGGKCLDLCVELVDFYF
jgi:hypothetical protein